MNLDPETRARIEELRRKTVAGTATLDDMKLGIILMRSGRTQAASASKPASGGGRAAKKPARSADDMLSEFESGS